ncbi:MAG: L-seryl-tRNA(Sec) selenium transferase [Candidatus Marinimicrobia bacterium]|nr:L-seryl-tRNA(Sec) selenium transferase [Candidatus Neomarinimicrobiota bacterium]
MDKPNVLKNLPGVDVVLKGMDEGEYRLPRAYILEVIRSEIQRLREEILQSDDDLPEPDSLREQVLKNVEMWCKSRSAGSLKSVINATGIVLHTGLGRAPLSEITIDALHEAAQGYSNLEFDVDSGERGQRNDHIEDLLCALTGAESGLLVNNNAAAVMLALNTLSEGKKAIISRGQLVEIGGSFRIPDVMEKSGATMVEVGTTNRTHLKDYENAITDDTHLILIAHTSNFKIEGFTASPELTDLIELAHSHSIPVMYDLGSGALFDMEQFGLPPELMVSDIVEAGVDVVTFSGDKLIGGPQGGLIVGKKEYLERIKKNPMTRALRCDKLTYAAMEAALQTYTSSDELKQNNQTYALLTRSVEALEEIGTTVLNDLNADTIMALGLEMVDAETEAGSGSLPTEKMPSKALVIHTDTWTPNKIMRWMRSRDYPIIGYIQNDLCYFNLRAILPGQIEPLTKAFTELAKVMNS